MSGGRKRLALLGSTGSIGASTLDIVATFPDRFEVVAMAAGSRVERLAEQVLRFRPRLVSVREAADAERLAARLAGGPPVEIRWGTAGAVAVATHPDADLVVSAIVGAAGLEPTYAAIEAGRTVAIANKEPLVMAGSLIMAEAARRGVRIFPIDSEHSAIFQALCGHQKRDVRRLILTASGGPFLNLPKAELARVTVEAALKHPNWRMGPKITVDSATLMNKGLEVIEASWLFGIEPDRIAVHIHPQSIVHSMVEYIDGSVVAQLGVPDMRGPIAYALAYPDRLPLKLPPLDLCALPGLTFAEPDHERFPALGLAYRAARTGGTLPAVLNAANEVAVAAFLERRLPFVAIAAVIEAAMDAHAPRPVRTLADVLAADAEGRRLAAEAVGRYEGPAALA
ncbi:MAG TPA: 1-deoxy-D-xylulose-5-phosphate reductoisomerase [Thermodesulfobacteriota bacterium]|nr:1-deoxy-D-xylulose-5-phosphate reductoisomerase [Thermodesulfobacteriota bacterium]